MNLFIYCCGGLGREVADVALRLNTLHARWQRILFLDDAADLAFAPSDGIYSLAAALQEFGCSAMEAVIANGEPVVRRRLMEKLEAHGIALATLIDPSTVVSPTATIGAGTVVLPGGYISSQARIGRNVAIVAGSMVGHDVVVGDHCVISGHVNVGGGGMIGEESYLGMGVQVKEMIRIGRASIVGMGSVVFADVPDEVIAMGNPCRALRPNASRRIFNQGKQVIHDNQRTL